MSKQLLSIEVRGTLNRWDFHFYGDPRYLADWRADGLNVNVVVNTIPVWVVEIGLTRAWCILQDIVRGAWWPGRQEGKR